MKKLFYFIVCLAMITAITSCDLFDGETKSSSDSKDTTTIVVLPDTVKQKIVAQDSLMKALVAKIDELTNELNSSKENISLLDKSVKDLKSPKATWGYMSLAAIVIAIISLILMLFRPKGIKEERVYEIFEHCLDKSERVKKLTVNVNTLLNSQRSAKSNQQNVTLSSDIESRLLKLESRIQQMGNGFNNHPEAHSSQTSSNYREPSQRRIETEYQRTGYANINFGKLFTKILDSNQEGCVFSIKFKSQTKGEFTIISLDKIKSRNGWQEVVEYTGSIEDATSFKLEDIGVCEKIDENTWEVTRPLKIRLLK